MAQLDLIAGWSHGRATRLSLSRQSQRHEEWEER
jgi:hypothetical protein